MPKLSSEERLDTISSCVKSDAEPMLTEMLEGIRGVSQSHPSVNKREARYKIRYHNKLSQVEWKGLLLSARNMSKILHKVFNAVFNENFPVLPIFGESVSEVSYFVPKPKNFAEVTRFSEDIKKPCLKANQK